MGLYTFQFTASCEADQWLWESAKKTLIFNSQPHARLTVKAEKNILKIIHFQFTASCEADQPWKALTGTAYIFQFTASCEADRG